MIATGTDVRPLEVVFFMRGVRSRNLFEQMKGRGVRVVTETEFQQVTTDAKSKDRFVIVDAVGVCEQDLSDTHPLECKPAVSLEKLLKTVSFGNREPEVMSSVASRLARLNRRIGDEDRKKLEEIAGGASLSDIASGIVQALDPDVQIEAARKQTGAEEPTPEQIEQASTKLLDEAAKPLANNPPLRQQILAVKSALEQTIDTVSQDELLTAGYSAQAREKAGKMIESFEQFIRDNKDEIAALQVLYSRPYKQRLTYRQIKELAEAIKLPPRAWTPEALWRAYETLDKSKVRGSGGRMLTDIVSLVRFALQQENELRPFRQEVDERYDAWLATQESQGRQFSEEQREWLRLIRDHIASSMAIQPDDFEYSPFAQKGGLGKAYSIFGGELDQILGQLNGALVQ